MKYLIELSLCAALCCTSAFAGDIRGTVSCEGRGIPGVKVSDGREITLTDAEGKYLLHSKKEEGFVFICTPSGYVAEMVDELRIGFYAPLCAESDEDEVHDFRLKAQDQSSYNVLYVADIHMMNNEVRPDQKCLRENVMPFVRERLEVLARTGAPTYIMELGDFAHDHLWYEREWDINTSLSFFKSEGIRTPMYCVSGNHDNDGSRQGDRPAERLYREVLGPEFHSQDIGAQHWIFLDDIIYINTPVEGKKYDKGITGNCNYRHGLTQAEMDWLAKDLALLDDDADIYVCAHCPIIYDYPSKGMFPSSQMDSLSAMFARFGRVNVRSGHAHRMLHCNCPLYPVFRQIVVPALSGDVYSTDPDPLLGADGEPAGTIEESFCGRTATNAYHSVRHTDRPLRAYDMNSVRALWQTPDYRAAAAQYKGIADFADPSYENVIFVNWWEAEDGRKIEILENGKALEVTRTSDCDPYYAMSKQVWYSRTGMPYRSKYDNYRSMHMFRATASKARSTIVVRVLDEGGKTLYEEKIRRPKEFRDGAIQP